MPPTNNLKTYISSLFGGEKPENQAPQTLSGFFKAAGMSFMAGASMMALPAYAQDANIENASLRSTAQCAPLLKNQHGFTMTAFASALKHSKDNPGEIGVSVAKGGDITMQSEMLGTKFVNTFRGQGVESECFVDPEGAENGTAINFAIGGLAWKKDGFMNLDESTSKPTLVGATNEAKTGKQLIADAGIPRNTFP